MTACSGSKPAQHAADTASVVASRSITQVVADGESCALTSAGLAYCWGGYDSVVRSVPQPFADTVRWQALFPGWRWGCGVSAVGRTLCWGRNRSGQLGIPPDSATAHSLTAVQGLPSLSTIAIGLDHACGLALSGELYCWGANGDGELGHGTRALWEPPGPVAGRVRFFRVAAWSSTSCALAVDGRLYCWGLDHSGVLGDSADVCSEARPATEYDGPMPAVGCSSVPRPVETALRFVEIVFNHHGQPCGLTSAGGVHCFEPREVRQGGSHVLRAAEYQLTGGPFVSMTGGGHWCGLAADSSAYCWGRNSDGELGVGTYDQAHYAPVATPVVGGRRFRTVSAGSGHTCGLSTDAQVYCWGSNDNGELGDGTTRRSPIPVLVRFPVEGTNEPER